MGQKLRYLGPEDRATIERLHNDRAPVALIAEKIGVHPATIYRELRNGYTGAVDKYGFRVYSAKVAQITAERNFQKSRGKRQAALYGRPPETRLPYHDEHRIAGRIKRTPRKV